VEFSSQSPPFFFSCPNELLTSKLKLRGSMAQAGRQLQ
jgi:hypothetical protein